MCQVETFAFIGKKKVILSFGGHYEKILRSEAIGKKHNYTVLKGKKDMTFVKI